MSDAHELLKIYLSQRGHHGVTHVKLTADARRILDNFGKPKAILPRAETLQVATPSVSSTLITPVVLESSPSGLKSQSTPQLPALIRPLSKQEALRNLAQDYHLELAQLMVEGHPPVVFSAGTENAEVVFVGDAPSVEDEEAGEPFIGPAGQLMTKIIGAMGLRRSEIYLTNVSKLRPRGGGDERDSMMANLASPEEMARDLPWLEKELRLVEPKLVVVLGATAAVGMGIDGKQKRLRGNMHEFCGIPTIVTYHPLYLLRREAEDGGGLREKRLLWEDMLRAMEFLQIPISTKQRAYFTKSLR